MKTRNAIHLENILKTSLNEVADAILAHCKNNNIELPSSVEDYKKLKLYGLQPSVLCTQGIICSDAVRLAREKAGIDVRLTEDFRRLNALNDLLKFLEGSSFVSPIPKDKITRLSKITLICSVCDNEQNVTLHSLLRRANNLCKFCSDTSKSKISSRASELQAIANSNNCSILKVTDTTIDLVCNTCFKVSEDRHLKHFYYRKSFCCDVCSPIVRFGKTYLSTNLTKLVDGKVFDSAVEAQSYLLLRDCSNVHKLQTHTMYTALGCSSEVKYEADFVVNDKYVVEVSTFQEPHHPKYFEKIRNKKQIIESCTKYTFIFCNSLADVKRFILDVTK